MYLINNNKLGIFNNMLSFISNKLSILSNKPSVMCNKPSTPPPPVIRNVVNKKRDPRRSTPLFFLISRNETLRSGLQGNIWHNRGKGHKK